MKKILVAVFCMALVIIGTAQNPIIPSWFSLSGNNIWTGTNAFKGNVVMSNAWVLNTLNVDTLVSRLITVTNISYYGTANAGGFGITNMADGSAANHAATVGQANTSNTLWFAKDGSRKATGSFEINSNSLNEASYLDVLNVGGIKWGGTAAIGRSAGILKLYSFAGVKIEHDVTGSSLFYVDNTNGNITAGANITLTNGVVHSPRILSVPGATENFIDLSTGTWNNNAAITVQSRGGFGGQIGGQSGAIMDWGGSTVANGNAPAGGIAFTTTTGLAMLINSNSLVTISNGVNMAGGSITNVLNMRVGNIYYGLDYMSNVVTGANIICR